MYLSIVVLTHTYNHAHLQEIPEGPALLVVVGDLHGSRLEFVAVFHELGHRFGVGLLALQAPEGLSTGLRSREAAQTDPGVVHVSDAEGSCGLGDDTRFRGGLEGGGERVRGNKQVVVFVGDICRFSTS